VVFLGNEKIRWAASSATVLMSMTLDDKTVLKG
jgi:hypothetical protein